MTDPTVAERILGPCRCHQAYTSRKMIDPGCAWHEYHEEITDALVEARREGKGEPEDLDCANPYCEQKHQTISVRVHRVPPKIDV